ncbi:MAG TPA: hypothetical protein VMY77_10675 [Chitinophagaceae bacterium]|nr:hypothetical protein [Chitinophagaceae bacterium]
MNEYEGSPYKPLKNIEKTIETFQPTSLHKKTLHNYCRAIKK